MVVQQPLTKEFHTNDRHVHTTHLCLSGANVMSVNASRYTATNVDTSLDGPLILIPLSSAVLLSASNASHVVCRDSKVSVNTD
jgi:hypothetical protein